MGKFIVTRLFVWIIISVTDFAQLNTRDEMNNIGSGMKDKPIAASIIPPTYDSSWNGGKVKYFVHFWGNLELCFGILINNGELKQMGCCYFSTKNYKYGELEALFSSTNNNCWFFLFRESFRVPINEMREKNMF